VRLCASVPSRPLTSATRPVGWRLVSALAALSLPHPTGHACRRCAQRGWASHPAV